MPNSTSLQIAGIRLKTLKSQLEMVELDYDLVTQLKAAGKSYRLPIIQNTTETIGHGLDQENYRIIWGANILKAAEVAFAHATKSGGVIQVIKLDVDDDIDLVLDQMRISLESNHSDANRIEELEAKLNQIKELLG